MAERGSSGIYFLLILYILPFSLSEDCTFPGIQSNGNTLPFKGTFAIGEIVSFLCFDNYAIVGQANLTCQGDGTWDADIPVCVKMCPEISFTDTRVISKNVTLEDVNVIGDVLVWGCKDGYSLDPGQDDDQTVIVCQPGGWLTQSVITCSKIACPDPGIPIGVEREGDSFQFEDVVTFSCSNLEDVISSGSSLRTCQSNGTWSGSNPTCTFIDCMDPGMNALTTRTGDIFTYEAVVTYACMEDALQVSGSESINCQLDGTWSGEPIMCQYPTTNVITTVDVIQTTTLKKIEEDPSTTGVPGGHSIPMTTPIAIDTEESGLSSIVYIGGLIGGSLVFVFLIGSAICIFTSKPKRLRRKSNDVQKTDWVHKSATDAETEPVYEAPPYSDPNTHMEPLKSEHIGLAKSDSVRSEASYLTPDDIMSHDYQNVPEVLTRL